ncbi:MAG: hypothetical protein SGPRY_001380 [Prymnesium sp.]
MHCCPLNRLRQMPNCKAPNPQRSLWYMRHHYMARILSLGGYNILMLDGDFTAQRSPYPQLKVSRSHLTSGSSRILWAGLSALVSRRRRSLDITSSSRLTTLPRVTAST